MDNWVGSWMSLHLGGVM